MRKIGQYGVRATSTLAPNIENNLLPLTKPKLKLESTRQM
jgi:hypothetical protein